MSRASTSVEAGSGPARPTGARSAMFLSVGEAANLLGMSGMTVYRAIRAGEFPAVKIRGRYVIPRRVIEAMEESALAAGTVVDAAEWAKNWSAA